MDKMSIQKGQAITNPRVDRKIQNEDASAIPKSSTL